MSAIATMSRRRSSRLNAALDASFQIPLDVDSTANNLLLEDDALEHDFFDGYDYTLNTPILTKPSSSNLSSSNLRLQQEDLVPALSEQVNADQSYDYAQEEREVELHGTGVDENTPRIQRVLESADFGLSPTPRARKGKKQHSGVSGVTSRLPSSIASSPVVSEYILKQRKGSVASSSPMRPTPRSSTSPSVTPKPRQARLRSSRASSSVQSTPNAATTPSSVPRPDKAQLREASREPDIPMTHSGHAQPSCNHSAALSESESVASAKITRTKPASARRLSYDPYSPGKRPDKPLEPFRFEQVRVSQRRQSRSRTRSASPSFLSRVAYDAVMLPIQEEDEDLQDRDELSPISKPQDSSDFSAYADDRMTGRGHGLTEKKILDKEAEPDVSSSLVADSSRARVNATPSRKATVKRSGDRLVSQRAPKKRKSNINVIPPAPSLIKDGSSGVRLTCLSPVNPTPIYAVPTEMPTEVLVDAEKNAISSSAKPVPPDSTSQASSAPAPHSLVIESRSKLPSGKTNVSRTPPELNDEPDEVQNFLSRYAKKYGSGADGIANTSSVVPRKLSPVASKQNSDNPEVSYSPRLRDATAEADAPNGKPAQNKPRHPAASADRKGKFASGEPASKAGARQISTVKPATAKSRSISSGKGGDPGMPRKAASRTEIPLDQPVTASQATAERVVESTEEMVQHLASSRSREMLPCVNQPIANVPLQQTAEIYSDKGALTSAGSSAEQDNHARTREFQNPAEPPHSHVPEPSTVLPEHKTLPGSKPVLTVQKEKDVQIGSHNQQPADHEPSRRPSAVSALQVNKRHTKSKPQTDDMFARKKRDNYLQKGLDLTAHSSRRYVQKSAPIADTGNKLSRVQSRESTNPRDHRPPKSSANTAIYLAPTNAVVAGSSRSMMPVFDLTSDAEDQKIEQRGASDLECRDCSETKAPGAVQRSKIRTEQVVKPTSRENGDTGQIQKSKLSEHARTKTGKEVAPNSGDDGNSNSGNAMTERLVNFGQRIMGSFGLLNTHSETGDAECASKMVSRTSESDHARQASKESRGSDAHRETSTVAAGYLSPREIGQDELGGHDLIPISNDDIDRAQSEDRNHDGQMNLDVSEARSTSGNHTSIVAIDGELEVLVAPDDESEVSRTSRKRSMSKNLENTMHGNDNDLNSERSRKKVKLSCVEETSAGGTVAGPSNVSRSDKFRRLTSERSNGPKNGTRGLLSSKRSKTTITRISSCNSETNSSNNPSNDAGTRGLKACTLTVPVAPAFTTDALRQQRLLAKRERDLEQVKKYDQQKAKLSKSDDMDAGKSAKARPPPNIQTREPWKPTAPHAFRFETDTRQTRRRDFENKLKTWEQRATAGSSQTSQAASKKGLPDFKGLHAAQEASLATMAARRRERIAPTVPVSPHFAVDIRLAERQKLEEARRAKEAEAERLLEEQRRARQEEEEREWREARKRTVPRANAVPEWYSQAPKRTVESR